MILINGSKIIEHIDLCDNGELKRHSVKYSFSNSSHIYNEFDKNGIVENIIPFIEIPSIIERKWIECELGYLNIEKSSKENSEIKIGDISITSIKIIGDHRQNRSYGYRYGNDDLELHYHYEISIKIHSKKSSETSNYLLYSDDLILKKTWGEYDRSKVKTMKCLFKNVIPLLNEYVRLGNPLDLVNLNYLKKMLPQKDNYSPKVAQFTLSDAMNIVYSMHIEIANSGNIVRFGSETEEYLNYYITDLFNTILEINLKYDMEMKTIYSSLPLIPYSFNENADSIKEYLSCLLYLGIIKNFDEERAKKEYLVTIPKEGITSSSLIKHIVKILPDDGFKKIFNFIFNMSATHFADGQTRVGRDDREWKEISFIFPLVPFFSPNTLLIQSINKLLNIKLSYETEKKSPYSLDSHPARYSYFEIYDNEYIGGLACCRTDIGSANLRKSSFHKLVCFFYRTLFL